MPFVIRQSMGEFGWVIKLTELKHNVPLDDAIFEKPAAQSGSSPAKQ